MPDIFITVFLQPRRMPGHSECSLNLCGRKKQNRERGKGMEKRKRGRNITYNSHSVFLFLSHTHNEYTGTLIHIHINIIHKFHTLNIESKSCKISLFIFVRL